MDDRRLILTIAADFGTAAPYAWVRREGSRDLPWAEQWPDADGSLNDMYLGSCIADAAGFCCDELSISKELREDFEDWAVWFGLHGEYRRFNWKRFNDRGILLAKRLKREIGDKAVVRYIKHIEDPDWEENLMMFIENLEEEGSEKRPDPTCAEEPHSITGEGGTNLIVSIMPDYGNAAYGWIRRDGTPEDGPVGGCFADSVGWYCDELPISDRLREDFEEWSIRFESWECSLSSSNYRSFNWEHFHKRGLTLAKRLKREVGDRAVVRYVKPYEDPNHEIEGMVIIE